MNIRWVGSYVHHVVEKQKLPSFFIDGFDKFEQKSDGKDMEEETKFYFYSYSYLSKSMHIKLFEINIHEK